MVPFFLSTGFSDGSIVFPSFPPRSPTISFLVTAVYGALDEIHQLFVPGREVDIFDVVADAAGGLICIGLLLVHDSRKPTSNG